jgi:hypothetical protein
MTRADVEKFMVARIGNILAFVQLNGTTVDGTNPDLNDPIADGLETQQIYPANRLAVADTDLAHLLPANVQWFLRTVELRALQTCSNQFIYYSETFVDNTERIIEVREGVQKRIGCLETEIKDRWGDKAAGFWVGPMGQCPPTGQPTTGRPQPVCPCPPPYVDLSKFNL